MLHTIQGRINVCQHRVPICIKARLSKETSTREALARQVGADGDPPLAWVQTADPALGLSDLPALEALRQIWLQPYDRCTASGLEALRWRAGDEPPPAAESLPWLRAHAPPAAPQCHRDACGPSDRLALG